MVPELMPHIVDANQNRDHIRLQVQAVPLPSGQQIHHPVAADAAVHHLAVSVLSHQVCLQQARIPAACGVGVPVVPSPAVRDGISLK
jgi:hypothetical protein